MRYGDLVRTAFLITGSIHSAEDLVQTVLLKAYRGWDTIDDPFPYLHRAMVNMYISLWWRVGSHELITGFQPDRSTTDVSLAFAQRAELLEALARLPKRMRAVLVLRYWEDLSEARLVVATRFSAINQTGLFMTGPRGASPEDLLPPKGSKAVEIKALKPYTVADFAFGGQEMSYAGWGLHPKAVSSQLRSRSNGRTHRAVTM